VNQREASIVRLGPDGHELGRQQYSAGLSIHGADEARLTADIVALARA
jgi:hypothetical protein